MKKFKPILKKKYEGRTIPKKMPKQLILLPLIERPFFPPQTLPLLLDKDPWYQSIKKTIEKGTHIAGLILTHASSSDESKAEDIYSMGTAIRIHQPVQIGDQIQIIAEGITRFKIKKWIHEKPPFLVEVEYVQEVHSRNPEKDKAYTTAIVNILKELIPLNPLYSEELRFFLKKFVPDDPSYLSDFAASLTSAPKEELQEILLTLDVSKRLKKVVLLLKKEIEIIKMQMRISKEVEEKIDEQQRHFFLNEQLKTIQKELGISKDDRTVEIDKIEERLKKLDLPEHAKSKIEEELDKISVLEIGSPEYTITRNYLELISNLPWNKFSKDKFNLHKAKLILNKEHEGLGDIKDRILEFIAVGVLKGKIGGSIILLVGPPGVGKTSIGRSIANAIGRKFYRFSVGGMRDEAEIKGHRRTYIGAMPGKIIQALKELNVSNPIIMLDEIDKIGSSFNGDPASALLEALDPEQNKDFLDHYLDTRFDLSKILFICTANQLDTIPQALLDRMEILHLAGYIAEEKIKIAKKHLWPHALENAGLTKNQLSITDDAIYSIIQYYAREAGVRSLEKLLGRITRKAALKFVNKKENTIQIESQNLQEYLGIPPFIDEYPSEGIGVATGLAWTVLGGAILSIEATQHPSKEMGFKYTGQMGGVMKESAEIAFTYVMSTLSEYHLDPNVFRNSMVHLHLPEGATPKDGPSAGITMATALFSLAMQKPAKPMIAMTGELTLTGKVLPVGGIKEKIIAAKRSKIHEIILPESVKKDYEELPQYIKKGLTIHFVKEYPEVFRLMFL